MTAGKVIPIELAALARGDLSGAIERIAARALAWDHDAVHVAGGICDFEVMEGAKVPADFGRCFVCHISVLPGQCPGCHGVVEPPGGKESLVPLYDFICDAGHIEERLCSAAAAAEPGPCRAPSDGGGWRFAHGQDLLRAATPTPPLHPRPDLSRRRPLEEVVGPLYFGCWNHNPREAGHAIWNAEHRRPKAEEIPSFAGPHGWSLDGKFCPLGAQVEGLCVLTQLEGWTMLSFWDRSGDKRGNSNSNFLFPGTLGQQEILDAARSTFPELFARFPFQVAFGKPGDAPAARVRR